LAHRLRLLAVVCGGKSPTNIVIAKRPAALRKAIPGLRGDADNGLSFDFRQLLDRC
jgi:hypothetical protein